VNSRRFRLQDIGKRGAGGPNERVPEGIERRGGMKSGTAGAERKIDITSLARAWQRSDGETEKRRGERGRAKIGKKSKRVRSFS